MTVQPGLIKMPDIDQSEERDGEVDGDRGTTSTALVPLASTTQWAPKIPLAHADPSFVTQLIATAAHEAQTRELRRASPADAQHAYEPEARERRSVTRRTKQII